MTAKKIGYLLCSILFLTFMFIYGCGDDSRGYWIEQAGDKSINLAGGDGTVGYGGYGGWIDEIYSYFDVIFSKTGSVDTGFAIPDYKAPINLGARGIIGDEDYVLQVYQNGDPKPPEGDTYLILGYSNVFISDGVGNIDTANLDPIATGAQINAGVTVTVGLNMAWYGNSGQETCWISFPNDVVINGTIKTKDLTTGNLGGATIDFRLGATATARDKGILYIDANRIFMGTTGKIDTKGDDATVDGDRGGCGGAVWLYADYGGVFFNGGSIDARGGNGLGTGWGGDGATYDNWNPDGIYIWSDSVIINKAAMDASGGNGSDGGYAGYVEFYCYSHIYNTAALTSNGGAGAAGYGGDAEDDGGIYIYSYYASVFNSGALTSNGGSGATDAGDGGEIYIYGAYSGYAGNIVNSGALTANGGAATGGYGGYGGYIDLETYGGDVKTSGAITANGGNSTEGYGGYGGYLYFGSWEGEDYGEGNDVVPGDILVTGNISLKGGTGAYGGHGGRMQAYNDYSYYDHTKRATIEFLGYGATPGVNLNGGNGVTEGGWGGWFYIETYNSWAPKEPTGFITNDVSIVAKGGAATASGWGGDGGWVEFVTDGDMYIGTTKLVNSGSIDVSGGNSVDLGGWGGGVYLYGFDLCQNSGAITANGGDATGAGGVGGSGAYWEIGLASSYDVSNTGTLTAKGGSGTGAAGSGGQGAYDYIWLYAGNLVKNSGSIYGQGGNATEGGDNGSGGYVDLFSQKGPTSNTATIINVAKGTGGTGGSNGIIYLDWVDVTPSDGTLP